MRLQADLSNTAVGHVLQDRQKEEKAKAKDIVQYYLDTYPEVYALICDKCHEQLAIEYLDLGNPNTHHLQARQVIAVSAKFKSYRPRLDGAMGYKCACGNDTRLASVEAGIVPVVKIMDDGSHVIPDGGMELHPHHTGMVQERMQKEGYTPNIRVRGKDKVTESFRVRSLK